MSNGGLGRERKKGSNPSFEVFILGHFSIASPVRAGIRRYGTPVLSASTQVQPQI